MNNFTVRSWVPPTLQMSRFEGIYQPCGPCSRFDFVLFLVRFVSAEWLLNMRHGKLICHVSMETLSGHGRRNLYLIITSCLPTFHLVSSWLPCCSNVQARITWRSEHRTTCDAIYRERNCRSWLTVLLVANPVGHLMSL